MLWKEKDIVRVRGQVKVVATDRHVSIKSDMKRNFPDVDHQFHVCHLAKRVTKKLTEKTKKKDCGDLFPWIMSVSNHLWWCVDTCNANKELLREKWISIVHHTANIYQWDSADSYHECPHPPFPRDVARTKKSKEELCFKVVFPKRSKKWVAKPFMEKTTRNHLQPMLDAIVERKKKKKDAADRSAAVTAPPIPHNIACTPRPDKAEVIARHTSRFSAS